MNFQTGQKYKIYFQLVNVVLARPNTLLLTYLVLIVSKAHKPFTEDLHYCLSADICCTMPQGHPWSFIFSTDVRHVSLADLFFFQVESILSYPWYFWCFLSQNIANPLLRLSFIRSDMAAVWVVLYSSSLLILFGQNILRILWRHLVWKVSSFCMILCGKCILKCTSNRTRMLLFSFPLTFGVKCKPWKVTDLVLLSSSYRFWECLWTTVPSVCFLCLCHSLSFRVFDSLFHSCTEKSMCACMFLCVKP